MGMPSEVTVDLTGLWHRETQVMGAYTYGTETLPNGIRKRTFLLAIELANEIRAEQMLSATYPLSEYQQALRHASEAGARGAIKVAFDMRQEKLR
jgi:threonine dehydrogenase-like Zn-dependent dehydrogenase